MGFSFSFPRPTWSERSRAPLLFVGLALLFALLQSFGQHSKGVMVFNDITILTKQNPLHSAFEARQRLYHFGAFFLLIAWFLRDGRRHWLEVTLTLPLFLYFLTYVAAVESLTVGFLLLAVLLRQRWPLSWVVLLMLSLLAVVAGVWLAPTQEMHFGVLVLDKRPVAPPDQFLAGLLRTLAPSLFAWISFELLLRLREDQARLQAALQELRESRQQELRFLALEERAQLSRELHDTIGHHITALNLHAQRAQLLAGQTQADERIQADLAQIRTQGGEVVRQLAAVVQTLRDPAEGGAGSLSGALRALCSQWPVTVHLTLPEQEPSLGAAVRVTLYRVCQEALTNAAKHAPDAEVWLDIALAGGLLKVTARNHLRSGAAQTPSGQGLRGLGERLEQLGGRLDARRVGEEFVLQVWLPMEGSQVDV